MLNLLTILATSYLIAFSGAAMPGPLMTVTISESARRGFISGPLLMLGHAMLELSLLTLLMFGLAPYLKQDWVFAVIGIVGGIMLAWMGMGMLRSIPKLSIHTDINSSQGSHLVLSGILVSVSNPYWSLWWATIGLAYVLYSAQFGPWGIVFFFIGHTLGDLTWYCAISLAMSKGKRFLSDTHYRALIGTCAVFLLLLAGYFAYSGVSRAFALV